MFVSHNARQKPSRLLNITLNRLFTELKKCSRNFRSVTARNVQQLAATLGADPRPSNFYTAKSVTWHAASNNNLHPLSPPSKQCAREYSRLLDTVSAPGPSTPESPVGVGAARHGARRQQGVTAANLDMTGLSASQQVVKLLTVQLMDELKEQIQRDEFRRYKREVEDVVDGKVSAEQVLQMTEEAKMENQRAGIADDDESIESWRRHFRDSDWRGAGPFWSDFSPQLPEKDALPAAEKMDTSPALPDPEKGDDPETRANEPLAKLIIRKIAQESPEKSGSAEIVRSALQSPGPAPDTPTPDAAGAASPPISPASSSSTSRRQLPPRAAKDAASPAAQAAFEELNPKVAISPGSSKVTPVKGPSVALAPAPTPASGAKVVGESKKVKESEVKLDSGRPARTRQRRVSDASTDTTVSRASVSTQGPSVGAGTTLDAKVWRQRAMHAWRAISAHRHANVFAQPVTETLARGYRNVIKWPMDLSTIKKQIESGHIHTAAQFKNALLLMFANAVMFNSTGHEVNDIAKEMLPDALRELKESMNLDESSLSEATTKRRSLRFH